MNAGTEGNVLSEVAWLVSVLCEGDPEWLLCPRCECVRQITVGQDGLAISW